MLNNMKRLIQRPLVRDTIKTTGFSTVGKAFGYLIPFFIATWFGTGSIMDAFFYTYGIILFLTSVFASSVSNVIVPYIAEAKAKKEDVGGFVGNVILLSGIIPFCLAVSLIIITKPLLTIITDFNENTLNLIQILLIEMIPLVILTIWSRIFDGALNAYKKFILPAVSPAFRSILVVFITFLLKDTWSIHSIILGYTAGEFLRLIILFCVIKKADCFHLYFSRKYNKSIFIFLKKSSYMIIGLILININSFIDKTMTSWLGNESVSILHYADRLYTIPVTFIVTGIMVTLLSHWSALYYDDKKLKIERDVKKAVKIIAFMTIPVTGILLLFHQHITAFAFGRGVFNTENIVEVGKTYACYTVGFIPYILALVYSRGHIVMKNTKITMWCSLLMCFVNIILNFLLMKPLHIAGIALSTSLTYITGFFFFMITFKLRVAQEKKMKSSSE